MDRESQKSKNKPVLASFLMPKAMKDPVYACCKMNYLYLDDLFENLQSTMVGSFYVTMHNNLSDVVKTRDMILGDPFLCQNKFNLKTITSGKEANDKGIGYKENEKVSFKEGGRGPKVVVKGNRGIKEVLITEIQEDKQ